MPRRCSLICRLFGLHGVQQRARNTFKALALFLCWDFSSWQVTTNRWAGE
jgi:hypothetical protein